MDVTALTGHIDPGEAREFVRELRRQRLMDDPRRALRGTGCAVIVLALGLGGILLLIALLVPGMPVRSIVSAFAAALVFALVPAVAFAARTARQNARQNARSLRLHRFARANGMTWVPRVKSPPLPGLLFGVGMDREATDVVRWTAPRFVEIANYRFTSGIGRNRREHRWGYVAIQLDAPLPHIVLDATGNNGPIGISNLPVTVARGQRLSLEGDFDRYFTLWCPAGYERDALSLFTPDIMARFVDDAAALDVEIVDDRLFLYARGDLSTLDPAMWEWLRATVDALSAKLDRWGRWRDDRLSPDVPVAPPPPGVAAPGRRLRPGVPAWAWLVGGVAGLVTVWVATTAFGAR